MSASIVTLKDKDENIVYPQTLDNAVFDATGKSQEGLNSKLYVLAKTLGYNVRYPVGVTYTIGKYLTNEDNPELASHENAKVSSPIALSAGDTIIFLTNGSGICTIALTTSTASSYTKEASITGASVIPAVSTYTATEACYVALSGVYTDLNYDFAIISGEGVAEKVDVLIQKVSGLYLYSENIFNPVAHDCSSALVTVGGVGNEWPMRIRPYDTLPHTTIKVPLKKGMWYKIPYHDTVSYNFIITSEVFDGEIIYIYSSTIFGYKILSDTDYVLGGDVTLDAVNGVCYFMAPSSGLYLYANIKFSTVFDYTSSFSVVECTVPTLDYGINDLNNRVASLEANNDKYYGDKVIYAFGDSLTWLGGDDCDGTRSGHAGQGWTQYFKEAIMPYLMKSYARSGSTLSCFTTSSEDADASYGSPNKDNILWNQFIRMKNDINDGKPVPDYILIASGINDGAIYENPTTYPELSAAIHDFLSDEVEDSLNTSIATSWYNTKTPSQCASIAKTLRWVKDLCISVCPNAQIILLTPLQGALCSVDIQHQIADRIIDCANYISAPVINQSRECGISRLQEAKGYTYTYDGTHTSVAGATRVGQILAQRFKCFAL